MNAYRTRALGAAARGAHSRGRRRAASVPSASESRGSMPSFHGTGTGFAELRAEVERVGVVVEAGLVAEEAGDRVAELVP